MQLDQLALFELPAAPQHEARREHVPRQRSEEASKKALPVQIELRLKLARKIAFKKRVREDPNATNDYHWSLEAIWRLHQELFRDWHDRFPAVQLKSEVLDYWSWMLADSKEPFAFRDVLIANGYRDPDSFIDSLVHHAPAWVLEALGKSN